MYYELYIDIFFLVNFMMDSLLLFSLRRILRCPVRAGRVFLGGATGAGLTCLMVAVSMPAGIKIPVFFVGISGAMLCVGLRIRTVKEFFRALGFLYVTAFLFGGILQALHPYIRTVSLFFAAAVVSYYILNGCWKMLIRQRNMQKKICEVTLCTTSGEYHIKALSDTGNVLTDTITGEPVCVIGAGLARKIWGEGMPGENGGGIRYIPYRTVNGEGIMPVIRIEKMCIHLPEKYWREKPLIGISGETPAEQDEYQMILNSDILGGIKHGSKSSGTAAV